MKTLILPVAGASSRFPGMRPKWLLTMPDGKLMVEKSIEEIDRSKYDQVILVCLKEHIETYLSNESFQSILFAIGGERARAVLLDNPTRSQSETVAAAIAQCDLTGGIFVKDCDNMFSFDWDGGNQIAVLDLSETGLIDAKSKSYIQRDPLGNCRNIVEKQVVSSEFCCGGYGFEDAQQFLRHFSSIKSSSEVYISHIIYSMLMKGVIFRADHAKNYVDWGTAREFRHYARSFLTLFCDVDGVVLQNGSKFGPNGWRTSAISENLGAIARLQGEGKLYLVITSSRPESEIEYIKKELAKFDVRADRFVMGLPHARRALVNDYSQTNPFPTAISINVERDSRTLSSILESITI